MILKKTLLALFATIFCIGVVFSQDALEPNDSFASSYDLTTELNASNGNLTINDLSITANNPDFYKIIISEKSELSINLIFARGNGIYDLDAFLYNASFVKIAAAESGTPNEVFNLASIEAGTYYLKVFGWGGATNSYTMHVQRSAYQLDDPYEANDSKATATDFTNALVTANGQLTVTNLKLVAANEDWYKITLSATSNLNTTVYFTHAAGNLNATLFRSNNTTVKVANSTTNNEVLNVSNLSPGDYFLQIKGATASVANLYSLFIESASYIHDDALEPNDTKATASNLTSELINGALYKSGLRINAGNVDWFQITLSNPGTISVVVVFEPGGGNRDLDTAIYTAANSILSVGESGTPNEVMKTGFLPAGDYFLKVYGWSNADNNYDLDINVEEVPGNQTPTANGQDISINEDEVANITLTGSDPENASLNFIIVTQTANGTLSGTNGVLSYTPNPNFYGIDGFSFKVNDGDNDSSVAFVTITVNAINDAPIAKNSLVASLKTGNNYFMLQASDVENDALTYTIVSAPIYGTLTSTATPGLFIYTPTGPVLDDALSFIANDGALDSQVAVVNITVDDRFEENDTLATAYDLTAEISNVYGHFAEKNLVVLSGDEDWFKIVLTERSELDLLWLFSPGNSVFDLDVKIYNENQTIIANAESGNDNEVVSFEDLAAGTYYIKVFGWAGASNVYEMQVELRPYSPDDIYEENDTKEVAYDLTGKLVSEKGQLLIKNLDLLNDDPDWYKITTTATTSELSFSIAFSHAEGDLNIALFDSANTQLAQSISTNNFEAIIQNALPAGDYYLRVVGATASDAASYEMVIEVDSFITDDIFEENDTKATAADLTSLFTNGVFSANNLRINSFDDDWFAFTTTSVSDVQILALFSPGNGLFDIDAVLENASGTIIKTAESGTDNEVMNISNLPIGTYYLKLYGWADAHNDYDLQISITGQSNNAPVAHNQSVETTEDTAKSITLTAIDANSDPLLYIVQTAPLHGTLTGTGSNLIYTPNTNYFGADSFTFIANDGLVNSNVAMVSVIVTAVNDAPNAVADAIVTDEDVSVTFNPLTNDTDVDSGLLEIISVTNGNKGNAIFTGSNITYTPHSNANGQDTFTYTIIDNQGGSSTANITVTINPINDAPVALQDFAVVDEDNSIVINVLSNDIDADGDTLTVIAISNVQNGSTITHVNNTITFTPALNFNGTASFNYTISDPSGLQASSVVTILVNPINDAPVAVDDNFTTGDATATFDVLENDSDVDGQTLNILSITQPSNGVAHISNNEITYTPNVNFFGTDSLNYTIGDGIASSVAVLNITVVDGGELTPSILSVQSAGLKKVFGLGETITVNVHFNGNVFVTGVPKLLLETGTIDYTANYDSGSGSSVLSFVITINDAVDVALLDYVNSNSLTLNGGSLRGFTGLNALLTLPEPNSTYSLSQSQISIFSNPALYPLVAPGTYNLARSLKFEAVNMNSATLKFYYTTDNSEPTLSSPFIVPSSQIDFVTSMTIKMFATDGINTTNVSQFNYTLQAISVSRRPTNILNIHYLNNSAYPINVISSSSFGASQIVNGELQGLLFDIYKQEDLNLLDDVVYDKYDLVPSVTRMKHIEIEVEGVYEESVISLSMNGSEIEIKPISGNGESVLFGVDISAIPNNSVIIFDLSIANVALGQTTLLTNVLSVSTKRVNASVVTAAVSAAAFLHEPVVKAGPVSVEVPISGSYDMTLSLSDAESVVVQISSEFDPILDGPLSGNIHPNDYIMCGSIDLAGNFKLGMEVLIADPYVDLVIPTVPVNPDFVCREEIDGESGIFSFILGWYLNTNNIALPSNIEFVCNAEEVFYCDLGIMLSALIDAGCFVYSKPNYAQPLVKVLGGFPSVTENSHYSCNVTLDVDASLPTLGIVGITQNELEITVSINNLDKPAWFTGANLVANSNGSGLQATSVGDDFAKFLLPEEYAPFEVELNAPTPLIAGDCDIRLNDYGRYQKSLIDIDGSISECGCNINVSKILKGYLEIGKKSIAQSTPTLASASLTVSINDGLVIKEVSSDSRIKPEEEGSSSITKNNVTVGSYSFKISGTAGPNMSPSGLAIGKIGGTSKVIILGLNPDLCDSGCLDNVSSASVLPSLGGDFSQSGGGTEVPGNSPTEDEVTKDEFGRVTFITYKNGGFVSFEYDDTLKRIKEERPGGNVVIFQYDSEFKKAIGKFIMSTGNSIGTGLSVGGSGIARITYEYISFVNENGQNEVLSEKHYEYDDKDRMTKQVNADGTEENWEYIEVDDMLVEVKYVDSSNVESSELYTIFKFGMGNLKPVKKSLYAGSRDEYGNETRLHYKELYGPAYDVTNLPDVISVKLANGNTNPEHNIFKGDYYYNSDLGVYKMTKNNFEFSIDGDYIYKGETIVGTIHRGNFLRETSIFRALNEFGVTVDAFEVSTNVEYYGAAIYKEEHYVNSSSGLVLSNYLIRSYFSNGQVKEEKQFDANDVLLTSATFDSNGKVVKEKYMSRSTVVENNFEYFYDEKGRLINQVDNSGSYMHYSFDDSSNADFEYLPASVNNNGEIVYYEYNSHGNVVKTYGDTNRPGVSVYDLDENLISFECKQWYPDTSTFGQTYYIEEYTYKDSKLISTKTSNADGSEFILNLNTYDQLSRVSTRTDSRGIVSKNVYSADTRLLSTIQDYGTNSTNLNITTIFEYDSFGRQSRIIREGLVSQTNYDIHGRILSTVMDPDGLNIAQSVYSYDSAGRLISVTDANGNVTQFEFDSLGRQYRTILPNGTINENEYDNGGNVIASVQDVNGLAIRTEYHFDTYGRQFKTIYAVGEVYQREDVVVFDHKGQVISMIEDQNGLSRETIYNYDNKGQTISVTLDPNGLNITSQSEYNEIGQLVKSIAPNGLETIYYYDYLGRQTTTVVDPSGAALTSHSFYDENSNVVKAIDPSGLEVAFIYDSLNRQTEQIIDPNGMNLKSQVLKFNRNGTVDFTTNSEGLVTKFLYDGLARNTHIIIDYGGEDLTSSKSYDNNGNVLIVTDALGSVYSFTYNNIGLLSSQTDANNNVTQLFYDSLGRKIKTVDALGVETTTAFDKLSRVTNQTVDPSGLSQTTYLVYDKLNRLTSVTNAKGILSIFEYDLADRKIISTEDPSGLNVSTIFEYNPLGQLLEIRDAQNNKTNYSYNILGQLTSETFADAGTKIYEYNAIGQRVFMQDQNNNQFTYSFDSLHRLTNVNIAKGVGVWGTSGQTFEYDSMSRLIKATDGNTEVTRSYDNLGRPISETQKVGTIVKTVSSQFNAIGRISKLTYPTGRVVDYTYNDNHLPSQVISNGVALATYNYNAVNAPISKTLGNGVQLTIGYNNRYQTTNHEWKDGSTTLTGYSYGFDSVGNRLYSENLVTPSKSEHFSFDDLNRLTNFDQGTLNPSKTGIASVTSNQNWNLDKVGNWATFTDNGTSSTNTFSSTHAMTAFQGQAITYDDNGNLSNDSNLTFKHDAFNRIVQVNNANGVVAEYIYDAFNRRVQKVATNKTTYLYNGFRVIEELGNSDTLEKEYVHGQMYIDEILIQKDQSLELYFTHDFRFSVTALIDANANIIESYDYKVYGKRTASGSGLTDIGYTGQRHDSETGLMYFRNRYYSVDRGSFVTRDPLGYVDGASMYLGYFGGNGMDPQGLFDEDGHFYTTFLAASAAGVAPNDAFELAYYSQLPDEVEEYEAIEVVKAEAKAKGQNFYDYGQLGLVATEKEYRWRRDIQEVLHSLAGGDAKTRQECLKKMLMNDKTLKTWEKGFIIHALGDAFSHTYEKDGKELLFKGPIGHGLKGHLPDIIALNKAKYNNYTKILSESLGGNGSVDTNLLRGFVDSLINKVALDTNHGQIFDPEKTSETSLRLFDSLYRSTNAFKGLKDEYKKYDPRKGMVELDRSVLPRPSISDVQKLIDKIKKSCKCGPKWD